MAYQQRINAEGTKIITNYAFGPTRNILLGAGLCYAVQMDKYLHIPVIILFPAIYTGYHMYKHKEKIVRWIRDVKKDIVN